MTYYVLVGGWPGSGKTTLARSLAEALGLACLSKDAIKEALMDALGAPESVADSQRLGRAAVHAVLRAAQGCPGAVIDSTWFEYALPLVQELAAPLVEVRCHADPDVVRQRYRARLRDERHLDAQRDEQALWSRPVAPLGVGPLVDVDTTTAVETPEVVARIRSVLPRSG